VNAPENVGNPPPADSGSTGDVGNETPETPDVGGDVPTTCPATDPTVGAPCALTTTTYCDYSKCDATGGHGKAYQCVDGRWTDAPVPSCNPPPVCPTTEPLPGTPCTTGGFGDCSYADTCPLRPPTASPADTDLLACAGSWHFVSTDYALPCPSSLPVEGTSCRCGVHSTYAGPCDYCAFSKGADCDPTTGTWHVSPIVCNPPFPDGGVDGSSGEAGAADASAGEVSPGP
jgi:hypothetical protein